MAPTVRVAATLGWLPLTWALSGGCHDVAGHVGASCDSDRDCREPYVCALGHCRAACDVDRDCDGGACLVIDDVTRVCTLPDESGCEGDGGPRCPTGFECGVDGECRNPCDEERACPADRRCVEGTCFDSSGDALGAGGSADGPANGGTSTGGRVATGGAAGEATHDGGEGGAIEDGGMGGTTSLGGAAGEAGSGGAEPACSQPGEPIRAGGSLLDWAQSVAVGPDGGIFVGGQFIGTSSFGDTSLVSAGAEDGFLARYRADRSLDWVRRGGGPYLDGIYSVAALPDGSVYAAGAFRGTATFGSISLTTSAQSSGFLAKYDATGTVVWAKAVGGTTFGGTNAVAAGPDGSARLLGYFQGEWAFDDVEDIASLKADAFLARFAPDGALTWVTQTAGPGGSQPIGERSLAVSADGASFITGEFQKPISIGSTLLTVTNGSEAFLAKYDDQGDAVWARQSNAQGGFASGWSVATSDDGAVYLGGRFGGTVTLSPKQLTGGGESGFLAKYRGDGSVDWVSGGAGRSLILSVAADSDGSAYVTGGFLGAASFEDVVFDGPSNDFTMFVAKMNPSGKPVWGQQAAGSSWGRGVAVQRGCSAQVVGNFTGVWSFGSATLSSRGQEDAFLVSVQAAVPSRAIAVEPMDDARHGHAAALLPNQQVLVTGGFGPTSWLSSAELYESSTQTWRAAADLHQR